jgi:hypothetical protein
MVARGGGSPLLRASPETRQNSVAPAGRRGAARAPRLARRHRLHLDVLEDLAVLGYVADVAFLSPDDAVAFDLTKTSGPEAGTNHRIGALGRNRTCALAALEDLRRLHAAETVLVSSHGGVIGCLLRALDGDMAFEHALEMPMPALFALTDETGEWRVSALPPMATSIEGAGGSLR